MIYSSCHDNQVSIVMRYEDDAYCLKKLHTKYELNTTKDKGVSDMLLLLPW